jgi:hypothetical protein
MSLFEPTAIPIGLGYMIGYFPVAGALIILDVLFFLYLQLIRKSPVALKRATQFGAVLFAAWYIVIQIYFVPQFRM